MVQKEEKITLVLLGMALLVLIIAYFGFIAGSFDHSVYSEESDIGDRVLLQGQVVGKRGTFTGDHLILTVDHKDGLVKVFINRNNGAAKVNDTVDIADSVEVKGILDEYEGDKEIIVEGPGDIRVVE
ncbi:MAG: nucleotide-binding protein [ANME-2 cluster archaeon]|nr:nucleotide-binding protein [ANME-2 cluster archaeon]